MYNITSYHIIACRITHTYMYMYVYIYIYIFIHTQEQADPADEVAHLPHAQLPDRHRGHQLETR